MKKLFRLFSAPFYLQWIEEGNIKDIERLTLLVFAFLPLLNLIPSICCGSDQPIEKSLISVNVHYTLLILISFCFHKYSKGRYFIEKFLAINLVSIILLPFVMLALFPIHFILYLVADFAFHYRLKMDQYDFAIIDLFPIIYGFVSFYIHARSLSCKNSDHIKQMS